MHTKKLKQKDRVKAKQKAFNQQTKDISKIRDKNSNLKPGSIHQQQESKKYAFLDELQKQNKDLNQNSNADMIMHIIEKDLKKQKKVADGVVDHVSLDGAVVNDGDAEMLNFGVDAQVPFVSNENENENEKSKDKEKSTGTLQVKKLRQTTMEMRKRFQHENAEEKDEKEHENAEEKVAKIKKVNKMHRMNQKISQRKRTMKQGLLPKMVS